MSNNHGTLVRHLELIYDYAEKTLGREGNHQTLKLERLSEQVNLIRTRSGGLASEDKNPVVLSVRCHHQHPGYIRFQSATVRRRSGVGCADRPHPS
ncbi:hypothetical protein RRG08_024054 [Elysia crispata]|uniref:Uncharacterized protein n=1 Tax=Elysia crispata TaxID=231223 RepID=A0AAE0ZNU0_9GAST|nr:hypothetical protein RRG08_024054 [Elysia crispata]